MTYIRGMGGGGGGGGVGGGLVGACIERKQEYMYILYIFCVFSFLYLTSVNSCLFFVLIH